MTIARLLAYALGAAIVGVGVMIPAAREFLVPAGAALLGLATRWPQDAPPPPPPSSK